MISVAAAHLGTDSEWRSTPSLERHSSASGSIAKLLRLRRYGVPVLTQIYEVSDPGEAAAIDPISRASTRSKKLLRNFGIRQPL